MSPGLRDFGFGLSHLTAKRWKAVIMGCFDDSGKESNPTNRFVCMAGYVAGDVNWNTLAPLWQNCAFKHGISGLHMKDAIPIEGEYKNLGWDRAKRDEVLSEFIDIIKESNLVGFGIGVDADAWRTLPEELIKEHGNSMQFCFFRLARKLVDRLIVAAPKDLFTLIFDYDQEYASRRLSVFSWLQAHNSIAQEYFASLAFANSRYFVGLQAADLLAWQTRKELIQKSGGFNSTSQFKELFAMTPGYVPDYVGEEWTKEEIEDKILKPWLDAHGKLTKDANAKGKTAQ
jgi:Protein of unknown function (DUF3800)